MNLSSSSLPSSSSNSHSFAIAPRPGFPSSRSSNQNLYSAPTQSYLEVYIGTYVSLHDLYVCVYVRVYMYLRTQEGPTCTHYDFYVCAQCSCTYVHGVSEKSVQNCFCQNFVKFPSILIIFGR